MASTGEKVATTLIRNIMIWTRNIDKTVAFYTEGLGLKLIHKSDDYAEIKDSNGFRIGFKQVTSQAFWSTGYSPILNFQLKNHENIDEYTKKLQEEYLAQLDGEIQKDELYEVATLRSEDGQMVSLIKANYQEEVDDEDLSTLKQESMLDPRQQEIRRLLESLKL